MNGFGVVTFTGRVISGFDGDMVDDRTGELKKYSPSLTIQDAETFDVVKVKCSKEEYEAYIGKPGMEVRVMGRIEKAAQPAVVMGRVENVGGKPKS